MKPTSQYLKTALLSLIVILGITLSASAQIQLGQDIDGEAAGDQSGYSVSMPDAFTVAIGAPGNDGNGPGSGHVRVFTWNGIAWTQKGLDIEGTVEDVSGFSISMPDSNTVAIGAIYDNDSNKAGHVRIFTWNGSTWIQKGQVIYGNTVNDRSGYSVSMPDANTVAIGSPFNNENGKDAGQVRVFAWNGNSWIQKGQNLNGDQAFDKSGNFVSMPDANTVVIGAPSLSVGYVRVFSWSINEWVQKGQDIEGLGWSVIMPDANTVAFRNIINGDNKPGFVQVFTWNDNFWLPKGDKINGASIYFYSTKSLCMPDANTIAITYDKNSTNLNGHVLIYSWYGNSWIQKGLKIDGANDFNQTAYSVSMPDSNTLAFGAPYNGNNDIQSGHVRVFKLKGVQGLVYNDLNQNCIKEELGIVAGIKGIIQPGNIIVETASNGAWYIDSLPIGAYTITYDTTSHWIPSCPYTFSFSVVDTDVISYTPSFGVVNPHPCPEPNVSIHMPFMRSGFSDQKVYVRVCNAVSATGALIDAFVDVSLDELINVSSASLSYTDQGNNTFRFYIGTINPGECFNFELFTTVSTAATIGQSLCLEALLFPVDSCMLDTIPLPAPPDFIPCDLPWDNSSLIVEVECVNDSIVFTITNIGLPGSGDMDCFSPIRLFIDGQYIRLDSIKLNGGESYTYTFPGDGRTWRMEVDQHPLHPRPFNPNVTIELCGDSTNWTPDLVNVLPQNDDAAFVDIFCAVVTGSYDPNDKTGFPLGVGQENIISPNTKMDYVIRFQNTGTDTAFTVVVRDTLVMDLDIFTVTSGVSSHPYNFRMHGPRVLEWTFNNILLPDSTTNEPGSNGFVTFTVHQVKDLPDGTEINNRVGIYFDYNEPIITNTTSHLVDRQLKTPSWTEKKAINGEACNNYEYNGFSYSKSGSYFQIKEDTLITLNLTINKVSDVSTLLYGNTITANNAVATYQWLDCENNYAIIPGETNSSFTASANGNYAVQLIENNCVDTSACIAITTVGIFDNTFTDKFSIYPNPTTGQLFIQFDAIQDELIVSLYTLDGKLLESNSTRNAAQLSYEIKAPAGIYILKISNNKQEATVKVVKE